MDSQWPSLPWRYYFLSEGDPTSAAAMRSAVNLRLRFLYRRRFLRCESSAMRASGSISSRNSLTAARMTSSHDFPVKRTTSSIVSNNRLWLSGIDVVGLRPRRGMFRFLNSVCEGASLRPIDAQRKRGGNFGSTSKRSHRARSSADSFFCFCAFGRLGDFLSFALGSRPRPIRPPPSAAFLLLRGRPRVLTDRVARLF